MKYIAKSIIINGEEYCTLDGKEFYPRAEFDLALVAIREQKLEEVVREKNRSQNTISTSSKPE